MNLKNNKGSIAVYVLIVLITMLFILVSIFYTSNAVRKSQLTTVVKIKQSYEKDNNRADEIYQYLINK